MCIAVLRLYLGVFSMGKYNCDYYNIFFIFYGKEGVFMGMGKLNSLLWEYIPFENFILYVIIEKIKFCCTLGHFREIC